jgi:hypothetical protein
METVPRSPLRFLAPIALVVFAIALFAIVGSSGSDDDGGTTREATAAKERDLGRTSRPRERRTDGRLPQDTYIVKTGDTLGSISQKTGVPIKKLQELNPELDPQALVSGQRIKLRE